MTSSRAEALAPPRGGTPPPDRVAGDDGAPIFLAPLAYEVARRHWDEFPDERERYGDAGFEWCVHDTQYLLGWAGAGDGVLSESVTWLGGVLAARGYPAERLGRSLELAADVVAERHGAGGATLAATLRAGAASFRV